MVLSEGFWKISENRCRVRGLCFQHSNIEQHRARKCPGKTPGHLLYTQDNPGVILLASLIQTVLSAPESHRIMCKCTRGLYRRSGTSPCPEAAIYFFSVLPGDKRSFTLLSYRWKGNRPRLPSAEQKGRYLFCCRRLPHRFLPSQQETWQSWSLHP